MSYTLYIVNKTLFDTCALFDTSVKAGAPRWERGEIGLPSAKQVIHFYIESLGASRMNPIRVPGERIPWASWWIDRPAMDLFRASCWTDPPGVVEGSHY